MPHEDENPTPLFTYAALAAMVGVFAAEFTRSDLAALNAFPWRMGQGELWRLITPTFVHGGVLHIVFNAVLFYQFSRALENWLGPWIALLLYAFFAAGSNAAEVLVSGRPAIFFDGTPFIVPGLVVGASGVVYGYFGFLWAVRKRRPDIAAVVTPYLIEAMLGWLAICAVLCFFGVSIANTAHAAGLALGWLIGSVYGRRTPWRWVFGATGLLLGSFVIAATYAPVWHATLGRLPVVSRWYSPDDPGPSIRAYYEHPLHPETPGLFQ